MLIAMASLVYFPALVFFAFLLGAMMILRPFIWREWVFAFLGLIIPYIFLISIYYLADIPLGSYFEDITAAFDKTLQQLKLSQIAGWSFVLVFTLLGSYFIVGTINSMKIHARKFFLVFLLFFLFSMLIFLTMRVTGAGMVYFVSIPLAYLFTNYFVNCHRTWYNEVFFLLFLIFLIWQRI
jgi:hypothetical protein